MNREIEKKYLVDKKALPDLTGGKLFIQGYLSIKPHIRFRAVRIKKNLFSITVTVKEISVDGFSRNEWNFLSDKKYSRKEVESFGNLSKTGVIEKERFKVKHKGLIWEIDVYKNRNEGLVTTDVEIPSKNYEIDDFPNWVRREKEITNDPEYFNRNLGKKPYQNWE